MDYVSREESSEDYRLISSRIHRRLFAFGFTLVLFANFHLFSKQRSVKWDAIDQWWNHFRYMGSALRQGYFPDFFPNIMSGYPLGAEIQAGVYNIFYLGATFLFPNSVLSVNAIYLLNQLAIFCFAYSIGSTYRLRAEASLYFALSIVASGFVIGHASHLSYLTSAVGLLGCFYGIRAAREQKYLISGTAIIFATYHSMSAGYPSVISFGAQCLAIYLVAASIMNQVKPKAIIVISASVFFGIMLSAPTWMHFLSFISQSTRAAGFDADYALTGSMPAYSVLNPFFPLWKMRYSEPTMERFHLVFTSIPFVFVSLWAAVVKNEINKRQIALWLVVVIVCTILALGKNSPIALREFLAEQLLVYRLGRFPSGEHRGIALFGLAFISSFGLNWLMSKVCIKNRILISVIALEFLVVMFGLKGMRISKPDEEYRGDVPAYQVVFAASDQKIIDAPRICTPDGDNWTFTAIKIQRDLAPFDFYWNGYVPLRSKRYDEARLVNADIFCGPSRLWSSKTRKPIDYKLMRYEPGYVRFSLDESSLEGDAQLIWGDTNDGFWRLRINGRSTEFLPTATSFREFVAGPNDKIEMIYAGPLSRFWRLQ